MASFAPAAASVAASVGASVGASVAASVAAGVAAGSSSSPPQAANNNAAVAARTAIRLMSGDTRGTPRGSGELGSEDVVVLDLPAREVRPADDPQRLVLPALDRGREDHVAVAARINAERARAGAPALRVAEDLVHVLRPAGEIVDPEAHDRTFLRGAQPGARARVVRGPDRLHHQLVLDRRPAGVALEVEPEDERGAGHGRAH